MFADPSSRTDPNADVLPTHREKALRKSSSSVVYSSYLEKMLIVISGERLEDTGVCSLAVELNAAIR